MKIANQTTNKNNNIRYTNNRYKKFNNNIWYPNSRYKKFNINIRHTDNRYNKFSNKSINYDKNKSLINKMFKRVKFVPKKREEDDNSFYNNGIYFVKTYQKKNVKPLLPKNFDVLGKKFYYPENRLKDLYKKYKASGAVLHEFKNDLVIKRYEFGAVQKKLFWKYHKTAAMEAYYKFYQSNFRNENLLLPLRGRALNAFYKNNCYIAKKTRRAIRQEEVEDLLEDWEPAEFIPKKVINKNLKKIYIHRFKYVNKGEKKVKIKNYSIFYHNRNILINSNVLSYFYYFLKNKKYPLFSKNWKNFNFYFSKFFSKELKNLKSLTTIKKYLFTLNHYFCNINKNSACIQSRGARNILKFAYYAKLWRLPLRTLANWFHSKLANVLKIKNIIKFLPKSNYYIREGVFGDANNTVLKTFKNLLLADAKNNKPFNKLFWKYKPANYGFLKWQQRTNIPVEETRKFSNWWQYLKTGSPFKKFLALWFVWDSESHPSNVWLPFPKVYPFSRREAEYFYLQKNYSNNKSVFPSPINTKHFLKFHKWKTFLKFKSSTRVKKVEKNFIRRKKKWNNKYALIVTNSRSNFFFTIVEAATGEAKKSFSSGKLKYRTTEDKRSVSAFINLSHKVGQYLEKLKIKFLDYIKFVFKFNVNRVRFNRYHMRGLISDLKFYDVRFALLAAVIKRPHSLGPRKPKLKRK